MSNSFLFVLFPNHSMVFIYKFCKKLVFFQPAGEPREHHKGEFRPKKLHIISKNTKWPEGSIYSSALLQKKWKMKSKGRKNIVFGKLLWKCAKIVLFWFIWIQFFLMSVYYRPISVYRPFQSFCLYEIFCSSNFYHFFFK